MESRTRDARLKSELNAMSRRASVNLTRPAEHPSLRKSPIAVRSGGFYSP
jgi:hypothetical protein